MAYVIGAGRRSRRAGWRDAHRVVARAPAVTRAAYALVIGEGMGRKEATWILRDAKIDDPATAITAAYAIGDDVPIPIGRRVV